MLSCKKRTIESLNKMNNFCSGLLQTRACQSAIRRWWCLSLSALLLMAPLPLYGRPVADKPSTVWNELKKEQQRIQENLSREIEKQTARPDDLENRLAPLIRAAADRSARFSLADWKGEELYALANIYQWAEQYDRASAAWRAYVAGGETKRDKEINARVNLVRALIELEKYDEADLALQQLDFSSPNLQTGYEALIVSRIALRKSLAVAYRDREQYEKAVRQARAGYNLMWRTGPSATMEPLLREQRDHDQAELVAIIITSLERLGKTAEAASFSRSATPYGAAEKSVFEQEMTAARLINGNAPGLKSQRWISTRQMKSDDVKGKVLLLNFWALWAVPSHTTFSYLREYHQKYADKGLVIVGLTHFYGRSDKEEDLNPEREYQVLQEFVRQHQINFPMAVSRQDDLTNEDKYSVISLPTMVLIDRQGKVRLIRRGTGNWRALEKQLAKLIEAQ